ncbi:alpha-ketoacid dehydrogenase subunit beta [Haloplanus pelagicus]|jgi:pyruvate dehydrogenase E1 component beta subunit|uniref:alpha-ketoacid dehydrogenase subunit beta n=1 Tax=Haloplanus pelagicus TaxID=2949995 RepID=UPI002041A871|nr:transketolase C-terminal domain-containing protein [Haloplanus sp. HW8-1]
MSALDATGEELSVREALRTALREELAQDGDVFLMGQDEEDGGSFEVTAGLYEEFGRDRVRDTPISETAQVGSGVGAAATGLRPVVNVSYSDFIAICFEPLMNQAAKMQYMFAGATTMPLTVRAIEGAGFNAAAQHSGTVHTLVSHLPGLKAVAPATPRGSKGLMKACVRSDDPVVFFEHKNIYEQTGPVPEDEDFTIPIGEAAVLREGADVTVVATQQLVAEALSVAEERTDVDVEVIDPQSLSPLDTATIAESVEKTGRLIVADESPLSYGFHAEVVTRVVENEFYSLDVPVQRVGVPDTPVPFSPPLEDEILPTAEEIDLAVDRIV